MSTVKGALDRIGLKSVQDIRRNLVENDSIASGKLVRSVSHRVREITGGFLFEILADKHWQFVDMGRKKGKQPPISAIRRWTKQKGIDQGLSFAIARAIGKRGIKGTNAFSDVTDRLTPTLELQQIYLQFIEKEINKDFQKLK